MSLDTNTCADKAVQTVCAAVDEWLKLSTLHQSGQRYLEVPIDCPGMSKSERKKYDPCDRAGVLKLMLGIVPFGVFEPGRAGSSDEFRVEGKFYQNIILQNIIVPVPIRRKGVARRILRHLEDASRTRGFPAFVVQMVFSDEMASIMDAETVQTYHPVYYDFQKRPWTDCDYVTDLTKAWKRGPAGKDEEDAEDAEDGGNVVAEGEGSDADSVVEMTA